jgi:TldD protein
VRLVTVDPAFLALPLRAVADAALQTARDAGAQHADARVERLRHQSLSLRDAALENLSDDVSVGLAVRVIVDGTWGFASSPDVSVDEARRLAREAVEVARTARPLNSQPIELADEPVYDDVTWVSGYEVDPFAVPTADKVALFTDWSRSLLANDHVDHVDVSHLQTLECKFYADTAGTVTTQQRVRLHPQVTGTRLDPGGGFETMRTLAAPVGRGWEYLTSGYDWAAELAQLPEDLAAKAKASSVEPGRYDLVIDPSNLWLTIHESIGHATELDRALGYEAAYAGTSFATPDQLGTLRYGTELMHVTGDRHTPHGLATVGYDDEGVAAQQWDLVRDGVLVGYQLDRRMAKQNGFGRSNGCAFADGPHRVPVQRMPHVSRQPLAEVPRPSSSSPGSSAASTSSVTRAGPSTCSATTSSSQGSGSTRSRPGGSWGSSAMSRTKPPPRSSGGPWRLSAGPRPTCSAALRTAGRLSPPRRPPSPMAARQRCSAG